MIKKFILNKYGETTLEDRVVQILSAQMQDDNLVVWMNTATTHSVPLRKVTFIAVYTGDPAPGATNYISTVQDDDLVYHVYAT